MPLPIKEGLYEQLLKQLLATLPIPPDIELADDKEHTAFNLPPKTDEYNPLVVLDCPFPIKAKHPFVMLQLPLPVKA